VGVVVVMVTYKGSAKSLLTQHLDKKDMENQSKKMNHMMSLVLQGMCMFILLSGPLHV
jgi:hypothetical protein